MTLTNRNPSPQVAYRRVHDTNLYSVLLRSHCSLKGPTRLVCWIYHARATWRDGAKSGGENAYPISKELLARETGLSPDVARDHRAKARDAGWLVGDYAANAHAGQAVPFALAVPESAWQAFVLCDGTRAGHRACATMKGKADAKVSPVIFPPPW